MANVPEMGGIRIYVRAVGRDGHAETVAEINGSHGVQEMQILDRDGNLQLATQAFTHVNVGPIKFRHDMITTVPVEFGDITTELIAPIDIVYILADGSTVRIDGEPAPPMVVK